MYEIRSQTLNAHNTLKRAPIADLFPTFPALANFMLIIFTVQPIVDSHLKSKRMNVKVIMKVHGALVSLAVSFALVGAQALALPAVSTAASARQTNPAEKKISGAPPASLSAPSSPAARHLFPVRDEKGLLLSCIAPELDTNKDTDVFNNCSLAPGRTLDDVMHSFIKAFHQEQKQQAEDHAAVQKDSDEKATVKAAQK
jgi:hypothetical protein